MGTAALPVAVTTATTPLPSLGSVPTFDSGRYPGSTSSAAYSVPRCVEFFHVESAWILVNGLFAKGCIYQISLWAYRTTCWSGLASLPRPSIESSSSGPPGLPRGTRVNWRDGLRGKFEWQPTNKTLMTARKMSGHLCLRQEVSAINLINLQLPPPWKGL